MEREARTRNRGMELLAVLLLLCGSKIAVADTLVFGIPLGEELAIPECAKTSYGYAPGTDKVCFERVFGKEKDTGPVVNETVSIKFPINELPQIIKGASISGLIIDGKLEGIGFNTAGVRTAKMVLEKLKEKYGEPDVFLPRTVTNRMGAAFDTFSAGWTLPELVILYQGILGDLDTGLVNIDTKKGSDHRSKKLRELTKDKRPL